MSTPNGISRRTLLGGLVAASVATGLAACAEPEQPAGPPASSIAPTVAPAYPSPSPTATEPPTPGPVRPAPTTDSEVLRRKIARMLVVGFRGFAIRPADPTTKALQAGLGGVILFDRDRVKGRRNIKSPEQLAALTASLRAAALGNLIVAIDQEGGRVSRLDQAQGFPATRSQAEVGATDDPNVALEAGRAMGATMAAAGIDLDLAPVVDVNVDPANPAIGALGRSFSADPSIVAAMAEAEIRGLHEFGIRAAIKHFPGLGSASADTDVDVVDVTATWTEAELEPFETLIGAELPDAIMSAHSLNRHLDPDAPASLSPATIDGLLRQRLGWTGVVITDDLGAVAITSRFERAEALARAIEAGNDLLLFANQAENPFDVVTQLVDSVVGLVASGRISESRIDQAGARLDILAAGRAIE